MAKAARNGYCNGSDMLVYVAGKAVGHCTSHTATFNSETKDRAVKPVATAPISAGLWKEKTITGLSISISAEGLTHYDETESGFKELFVAWKTAKPVIVKCMERDGENQPYLEGSFVITNLERTDPAQDDSTYSIQLENNGQPTTLDENAITENAAEKPGV